MLLIGIRAGCALFGSYLIPQIGIRVWLHFPWLKVLGHACMLVTFASLTLAFLVLVALHHVDHDYSKVVMRNLM